MPHLPRETKVDVTKCHACHVQGRQMSPSAATQECPSLTAPKRATRASPVPQVPRLSRKTKADVTKRHTCHVQGRQMSPSATPATQECQARHQSQPSPVSPTPATQLCVTKLYVTKLCVTKLYVTKSYVTKLCVTNLYATICM